MNSEKMKQNFFANLVEIYKLIKAIFSIANPNRLFLVLSLFCIIIASIAQAAGLGLVIPVLNGLIDNAQFLKISSTPVLGYFIKNAAFINSNIDIFVFMIVLIAAAVYIENVAIFFSEFLAADVSTNITHRIRSRAFERYLGFGKVFYDKVNMGEQNAVIMDEHIMGSCQEFIVWLNKMLATLAFALTFFLLLVVISWKLTAFVFILLSVTYYIMQLMSNRIRVSSKEGLKEKLKLFSHSWQILSNITLVKLYNTENKERDKFNAISGEFKRHAFNVLKKQAALLAIVDIVNSTSIVLIVCVSVFLFFLKDYSIGVFLIYFVILRRLTQHGRVIANQWSYVIRFIPLIKRILWIFEESDKPYIKNGNITFDGIKTGISYNNVYFSYRKGLPILKEVTFKNNKNKILAIVGPTGSGKTTAANLLPRFYEYDSGSIEINGRNIMDFDLKTLRKKIGIVNQDVMLMNDTIKNNIIYGLEKVHDTELDGATRNAQIYDFIMSLPERYDTFVGDRGVRLSGGEKQRISIARAILKNPDILILDEATSALDSETEKLMQKALKNILKERTVFVIAHRLSTIQDADWIVVLENGQVKEQGKLQELLKKKGRFYYYWQLQKLFY